MTEQQFRKIKIGMGAVFAAAVTIGGEWLPTGRTDIAVDRLLLDHFWVSIPPRLPALVGAKYCDGQRQCCDSSGYHRIGGG